MDRERELAYEWYHNEYIPFAGEDKPHPLFYKNLAMELWLLVRNLREIPYGENQSDDEKEELLVDLGKLNPINYKQLKPVELAPGIGNTQSICFHNSVAQLFYNITELTEFITHPKIIQQYKPGTYFYDFLNIIYKMRELSNPNVNNSIDDKSMSASIQHACLVLPNRAQKMQEYNELYTKYQQELQSNPKANAPQRPQDDAADFLGLIRNRMIIDCKDNNKNFSFINKNKICNDDNSQKLFLKDDDPRNWIQYIILSINSLDKLNYLIVQSFNGDIVLNKYLIIGLSTNLEYTVNINKELDFNPYGIPQKYELIGIVLHSGTDEGGHYVAHIKNNNTWYRYDDKERMLLSKYEQNRKSNDDSFKDKQKLLLFKQKIDKPIIEKMDDYIDKYELYNN